MFTKCLIPTYILLLAGSAPSQEVLQQRPRMLIRLEVKSWEAEQWREVFSSDLDVLEFDAGQKSLDAIATPAQLQELQRRGLRCTILHDDLEEYQRQLREQDYLDHFHDYRRTVEEIRLAEAVYPQLVKVVDLGDSWEKAEGLADRDIWAVKISDNAAAAEDEPEVLIIGQHHAREIITQEIVLDYMNYLLSHYGLDPYITYLVDHRQIWLVPILNPDGLDYVFSTDMIWRKNRRANEDGSFGIDLNRNYGFKWGYDNRGSSGNGFDSNYRGTAPFSEPETAALRDFVASHQFRAALSYHSFGNYVIYPWGYEDGPTPDHASFVALADSIVAYNHYHRGTGLETVGYTVNGDSDDWFYGEQIQKNKVFSMTPEVGTGADFFHPDTSRIQPLILENRGPNLFITYAVGEEPLVQHQPLPDTVYTAGPHRIVAQITGPIVLTEPAALVPQSYTLHFSTGGQLPFEEVALTATGNPAEYAGEIPAMAGGQNVNYFISAEDEKGRTGHAPRAALAGSWYSFFVAPPTTVHESKTPPDHFALHGFPNPFRNQITLQYELPADFSGAITLEIVNVLGQRVRLLVQGETRPGRYRIIWNGADDHDLLSSPGIYFYRLRTKDFVRVKKIAFVR
ncbi:MAG: M14 family zinc carboxypeptidase [bacterium]